MNWRDPWHPEGGGSELYVQQIAARLVDTGMRVTVFSASYAGAARREVRDGITYVRRGGHMTVYLWAAFFLLTRRFGRVDEVMEVQNGMPFLARLFTSRRSSSSSTTSIASSGPSSALSSPGSAG